jgi:hypothetical protein
MSKFSDRESSPSSSQTPPPPPRQDSFKPPTRDNVREVSPAIPSSSNYNMDGASSSQTRNGRERAVSSSRPMSMVQTYQPPLMDVNEDTLPELQPIFTFLNSHANKLYQEGYFLKLDDQNTRRFSSIIVSDFPADQYRWQSKCGPYLDRMFCTASWNGPLVMGRCRTRHCGTRWRSPTQIYKPD